MKMKNLFAKAIMLVLMFSLVASPVFATSQPKCQPKPKYHHNGFNNRIYFSPRVDNSATGIGISSSKSEANATAINMNSTKVDVSNQATGGNAEGGDAVIGDVTGVEGGINFSIRNPKNWLGGFEMTSPNIQPTFDFGELEDSTMFSNLMPLVVTRKMAEAAVPEAHPIQGFLKKLRLFTGVFDLKDSKEFDLYFIPKDETFDKDRPASDKLTLLKTWEQEKTFMVNYKQALEDGYVFINLGKIGGKAKADGDMLFNASMVGAMNLRMTHYAPHKFMSKKVATSDGNNLSLTGNMANSGADTAYNLAGGSGAETSHVYNDLAHGSHMLYFVQDEVRANEILSQMEGIPALSSKDESLNGKYLYKIFDEYARMLFNEPKILPEDQPVIADMGQFIVANWDFFKAEGLQPVIMIHRDERGPAPKTANQKYNGGLGLASGEVIRAAIKAEPHVTAFLKERGISDDEWNKMVVYATSGADHPLIAGAISPEDHQANRTAHLTIVPGGVRPGLKSTTKEVSYNNTNGGK